MLVLSNLIMHVYNKDQNKEEIVEILNAVKMNKNILKMKKTENIEEEMRRLKIISNKIKDDDIKNLIMGICNV